MESFPTVDTPVSDVSPAGSPWDIDPPANVPQPQMQARPRLQKRRSTSEIVLDATRSSIKELSYTVHFSFHSLTTFVSAVDAYIRTSADHYLLAPGKPNEKVASKDSTPKRSALQSGYAGRVSTVPARKRHPNFLMHMAIRCLQGLINYEYHTLSKLRIANTLLDITPVPNSATLKHVRLHINRPELLVYERRAADAVWGREGVNGYLIPEECTGSDDYELHGEWVLPREGLSSNRPSKVVLYIHGGGYITLSHKTHRVITSRIAKETGYRVLALDYRLAPEYPFPAAVHDAFASYLFLIDPTNPAFVNKSAFFQSTTPLHAPVAPEDIIIMGDSAGGGLSLALLLYLKSFLVSPNAPHAPVFDLPRSAALFSPWCDLACGMESWHRNIKTDYLPPLAPNFFHKMYSDTMNPVFSYLVGTEFSERDYLARPSAPRGKTMATAREIMRAGSGKGALEKVLAEAARKADGRKDSGVGVDREQDDVPMSQEDVHLTMLKWVRHPLISPLYGDFTGLCPIYIQAGSAEVLVDESNLIAYLLSRAGVHVQHEAYMDMPHVFQIIPSIISPPHQAFERVADFCAGSLDAESEPGVFIVDGWKENVGTWERLRTGYVDMFPPWEGTPRVPAENGSEEVEIVRLKEAKGARTRMVKGGATDSAAMFHPLMDYL